MHKGDGGQSLHEKPSDQAIELAAQSGNLVTREIALKQIPTELATALTTIAMTVSTAIRRVMGIAKQSLI